MALQGIGVVKSIWIKFKFTHSRHDYLDSYISLISRVLESRKIILVKFRRKKRHVGLPNRNCCLNLKFLNNQFQYQASSACRFIDALVNDIYMFFE